MKEMIITVANMSIAASYVILAILLCRLAMKGLPKKFSYLLWSAAAFRLICPVSFRSIYSLFSLRVFDLEKAQSANQNALSFIQQPSNTAAGAVSLGLSGTEIPLTAPSPAPSAAPAAQSAGNPLIFWLAVLWIAGMAALILYSAIRFILLKRSLRTAVKREKNVYSAEGIVSPFIVGLFRPKIYLPYGIEGADLEYALAHERVHLKRFDHGIKLFAWLLLTVHWFNPLVWLAFALMTRDMEMSCDEAVLSKMEGAKKGYGTTLLSIAANKRFPAPAPLAFGESGVKVRIKNVLKYKKPKLILRVIAAVLCLALITACAANPETPLTEEALISSGSETARPGAETQVGTGAEQNAGTGEGTSRPVAAEPDTETVTEIPAEETKPTPADEPAPPEELPTEKSNDLVESKSDTPAVTQPQENVIVYEEYDEIPEERIRALSDDEIISLMRNMIKMPKGYVDIADYTLQFTIDSAPTAEQALEMAKARVTYDSVDGSKYVATGASVIHENELCYLIKLYWNRIREGKTSEYSASVLCFKSRFIQYSAPLNNGRDFYLTIKDPSKIKPVLDLFEYSQLSELGGYKMLFSTVEKQEKVYYYHTYLLTTVYGDWGVQDEVSLVKKTYVINDSGTAFFHKEDVLKKVYGKIS